MASGPVHDLRTSIRRRSGSGQDVVLGPLRPDALEGLFRLFADVVARGDGYPQAPPLTWSVFEDTWVKPVTVAIEAAVDDRLVGAYYLKPNQPGLGAHIANAGYVVDRRWRGRGFGTLLVEDSIERAPLAGFDAIQFNFVFESNPARSMYERLGWIEIGRVPRAVGSTGEDAVIYWRPLDPTPLPGGC